MKIFEQDYETTKGEIKTAIIGCSCVSSLISNINKAIPDLKRIVGNPKRINRENEMFYNLKEFE